MNMVGKLQNVYVVAYYSDTSKRIPAKAGEDASVFLKRVSRIARDLGCTGEVTFEISDGTFIVYRTNDREMLMKELRARMASMIVPAPSEVAASEVQAEADAKVTALAQASVEEAKLTQPQIDLVKKTVEKALKAKRTKKVKPLYSDNQLKIIREFSFNSGHTKEQLLADNCNPIDYENVMEILGCTILQANGYLCSLFRQGLLEPRTYNAGTKRSPNKTKPVWLATVKFIEEHFRLFPNG